MSRPWAQGGDTGRARRSRHGFNLLVCDHVCYPPPPPLGGELHTENGCRHEKYLKMRRYSEGSAAFFAWLPALCYDVPSASYQCKLAASWGRSLSRLRLSFPRASTMLLALVRSSTCSCAPASHPLLNYLARDSSLTLSPLSLSSSLSSSPQGGAHPFHAQGA